MSEPSVLTYARFFDLTQDHTFYDPLTFLDTIPAHLHDPTISQNLDESVKNLVNNFERAARDYVSLANDDPLPISQEVANYLKSCTGHTIHDMNRIFDKLLPDPYRIRKLKLNLPLLVLGGGDVERDVRKIKKGVDFEIVVNDFLDDDDDKSGHSQNCEPPKSSTASAEILEWSKTQLEVAMKKEKLNVSLNTLEYIREVLSTSMEPAEISRIVLELTPKVPSLDKLDVYSITEDDFQLEVKTAVSGSSNILDADEYYNDETPPPIRRELDMLGRMDAASDEEYFLQNTQADREMDELFRQFTHHNSDDQDKVTVNGVDDEHFEDSPSAKRRKLSHETSGEIIPYNIGGNDRQDLKTRLEDLKIKIPEISGHITFGPSVLDLSIMPGQDDGGKVSENKVPDLGPPPFRIPTIQEALRESMPTQVKVAEKFIVEEKAIISSGMLLWKEPGLRALDPNDDDDKHIVADNYHIEEWKSNTFTSVQPDSTERPRTAYFFERLGHGEDANGPGHKLKMHELNVTPAAVKPEPVESVRVKKESQRAYIEERTTESDMLSVNPFARAEARFLSELDRVSKSAVKNRVSESVSRVQSLSGSPKLLDDSKDKKPAIPRDNLGLKSLLPEIKRKQVVQQTGVKNESILKDSLSSFLDLRGKQFKPPAIKRICEVAEVIDDPILSTQGSIPEEKFSDEQTLVLTLPHAAEAVQQQIVPPTTPLEEPRTIVVNSTLLQTKPLLIQFLDNPDTANLTLIYRDLDTKQHRGPDVILNTTTGLFITNLQSLCQRPLPGQKSATGLSSAHDLVANLACSYSQVVVLVHHPTSPDSATQLKTLSTQASFAAFCQNFTRMSPSEGRNIQPYWIPCTNAASTSNSVNAWVWQIISHCAYRNGDPQSPRPGGLAPPTLILEETLWELFLCKAGLNPLAAQVAISSLKRSCVQSRMGVDQATIWGLRRLVVMGSQERTKLFGNLIGAEVVERLNGVLSDRDEPKYRT